MSSIVTYGLMLKCCIWVVSILFLQLLLITPLCFSESIRTAKGGRKITVGNYQTVYFQRKDWSVVIDFFFPGCRKTETIYINLNSLVHSDPMRIYLGDYWSPKYIPPNAVYEVTMVRHFVTIRQGDLAIMNVIASPEKLTKDCFVQPVEMTFYGVDALRHTREISQTDPVDSATTTTTTTTAPYVTEDPLSTPTPKQTDSPSQPSAAIRGISSRPTPMIDIAVREFTPASAEITSKTGFISSEFTPAPAEIAPTATEFTPTPTRGTPGGATRSNNVSKFLYLVTFIILASVSLVVAYRTYRSCQRKRAGNDNVASTTTTTLFGDDPRETTGHDLYPMSLVDNDGDRGVSAPPLSDYDPPPSYDDLKDHWPPPSYEEVVGHNVDRPLKKRA